MTKIFFVLFTPLENSTIYSRNDINKGLISKRKKGVKALFFLTGFSCIFLCLILLEKNIFGQEETVTNVQNSVFLKERLKMLERIVEEKNRAIDSLKEQLAHQEKERLLLERQKAILELMANRGDRDLKSLPVVKKDDNLDKAIHINLGFSYAMKYKLQEAIEEYKLALKCDAEDKDIHYNLGYLLAKRGRCKEAIEEYKKALKGESSDREIYYNLALIYSTCIKDNRMADYYYEKFLSIFSVEGPAP